jgi:hypothetical protein
MSRADWPLDLALESLRRLSLPYKWDAADLRIWWSVCPACRTPDWTLRLREAGRGGPLSLFCACGCAEDLILWALSEDPARWRIAGLERQLAAAVDAAESARDIAALCLADGAPRGVPAPGPAPEVLAEAQQVLARAA